MNLGSGKHDKTSVKKFNKSTKSTFILFQAGSLIKNLDNASLIRKVRLNRFDQRIEMLDITELNLNAKH